MVGRADDDGGLAAPRRVSAGDRISIAVIGCGTQAYDNVNQLLQDPRARITVVCDPVREAKTGYGYEGKKPGGCVPFKQKIDASCSRRTGTAPPPSPPGTIVLKRPSRHFLSEFLFTESLSASSSSNARQHLKRPHAPFRNAGFWPLKRSAVRWAG